MTKNVLKQIPMFASVTRALTLFVIVACFAVLSSCGGDDEKPANKFTVDGNSIALSHAYMVSASGTVDGDEVSEHFIILTTSGLTYDSDEDELIGTGDVIFMLVGSQGLTLQKGKYELGDDEFEDLYLLQVGMGVEDGSVTEAFYYAEDGFMQVSSISDSKITLKFDFDEYEFETPDDDGQGEGSMKGYYSGKIEITEQAGGARAVKGGVLSSLRKR